MYRVLVVEDDPALLALLQVALEDEFEVMAAESVEQALQEMTQHGPPDAAVLDIMLPRITGLALLRNLRDEAETAEIPIVMLTALDGPGAEERGLENGADVYLTKPYNPLALPGILHNLLEEETTAQRLLGRLGRLAASIT